MFSFICVSNDILLCHGFSVSKKVNCCLWPRILTPVKAQEIPVAINQAFRTAALATTARPDAEAKQQRRLTKNEGGARIAHVAADNGSNG